MSGLLTSLDPVILLRMAWLGGQVLSAFCLVLVSGARKRTEDSDLIRVFNCEPDLVGLVHLLPLEINNNEPTLCYVF